MYIGSLLREGDMVLDDLTGHKATTRRFLEEDQLGDRVHEYGELCTADYTEHDPAMPQESIGLDEARETYRELAEAFQLRHSVDGMVAEVDLVAARFTVRGRHVGEYQGKPPTGRAFESTGQVTLLPGREDRRDLVQHRHAGVDGATRRRHIRRVTG